MDASAAMEAESIYNALVSGRESERAEAQARLEDSGRKIDRLALRQKIMDALAGEYKQDSDDPDASWTRPWLLSTLGRLAGNDPAALKVMQDQLNDSNPWVRFWALEGLIAGQVVGLTDIARQVVAQEDQRPPDSQANSLVREPAQALLAANGDAQAMQELTEALKDPQRRWAALRALRLVYIPSLVPNIIQMINDDTDPDVTYNAVIALSLVPPGTWRAEKAAETLADFARKNSRAPLRDGTRVKALAGLGKLKVRNSAPILLEALSDDNPAIVREAARALEKVVTPRTAVERIIEVAASNASQDQIRAFAYALRWMTYDKIVEELSTTMVSGSKDQQTYARQLLSEVGGIAAIEKLGAQTRAVTQYASELEKAEERVRALFEESLADARGGYKVATQMDQVVFFLGVGLLAASAIMALVTQGNLNQWVGLGLTGSGVLGVVYGVLIANPRKQVEEAVDHLMNLKVIFLGYLRQLHQLDQAFTIYMLQDKPPSLDEVQRFSEMLKQTMWGAIQELAGDKKGGGKDAATRAQMAQPTSSRTTDGTPPVEIRAGNAKDTPGASTSNAAAGNGPAAIPMASAANAADSGATLHQ